MFLTCSSSFFLFFKLHEPPTFILIASPLLSYPIYFPVKKNSEEGEGKGEATSVVKWKKEYGTIKEDERKDIYLYRNRDLSFE